jgi:hypothetical protein
MDVAMETLPVSHTPSYYRRRVATAVVVALALGGLLVVNVNTNRPQDARAQQQPAPRPPPAPAAVPTTTKDATTKAGAAVQPPSNGGKQLAGSTSNTSSSSSSGVASPPSGATNSSAATSAPAATTVATAAAPATVSVGASSLDFGPAKKLLQEVLSLIRHRYELDGIGAMFWLTANNVGAHTWDVIKYKFARKVVDSALSSSSSSGSSNNGGGKQQFLMIFGGSSVTAGHDNLYNQSYPFVVERRLKPVLDALGVSLLVRNIAQGANPCIPYSLCYETMGGMDPDFVGW